MRTLTARQIELLEDLPFGAIDRWYTLLALTGQKKASWLQLTSDIWRESEASLMVAKEQLERVEATLQVLGISFHVRTRETTAGPLQPENESDGRARYNQVVDFFIGHSIEDANELLAAYEAWDHKRIGMALGFPNTAVAVFATENAIASEDAAAAKKFPAEVAKHAYFMLSKEDAEDELRVVETWLQTLHETSSIITTGLEVL